jgi:hypothetical protein
MRSSFSTDAEQTLLPQIKDPHVCTTVRSVNKTHSGYYTVLAHKRVALILTICQSSWLIHFRRLQSATLLWKPQISHICFSNLCIDTITDASSFWGYDLLGCNIVHRGIPGYVVAHPRRHDLHNRHRFIFVVSFIAISAFQEVLDKGVSYIRCRPPHLTSLEPCNKSCCQSDPICKSIM